MVHMLGDTSEFSARSNNPRRAPQNRWPAVVNRLRGSIVKLLETDQTTSSVREPGTP